MVRISVSAAVGFILIWPVGKTNGYQFLAWHKNGIWEVNVTCRGVSSVRNA